MNDPTIMSVQFILLHLPFNSPLIATLETLNSRLMLLRCGATANMFGIDAGESRNMSQALKQAIVTILSIDPKGIHYDQVMHFYHAAKLSITLDQLAGIVAPTLVSVR